LKRSNTIFPLQSRSFRGQRWVNILLRTAHLVGIAGVAGGALFQLPIELWLNYLYITVLSGCTMVIIEIWTNGIWLIQLRGLATLLKLAILSLALSADLQAYMIFSAIILSGIFSHAPGKVRYYSIFHGKVIEQL